MDEAELAEAIARMKWVTAKSMPRIPHEYTRRKFGDDRDFRALFDAIQQSEVIERFNGLRYRYLYLGDFKYWTMTTRLEKCILINRAAVSPPPTFRRPPCIEC